MDTSSLYEPPKWAGKPPPGYHLDVLKEGKLFQKLMIDEKPYYLFGRNMQLTDFCIDHASCSRVHAALVYHKHLDRFFLTDLGSTHGSHIGNVQLEPNKPTQLPMDSQFHFGASTRIYVLRDRPKVNNSNNNTSSGVGKTSLKHTSTTPSASTSSDDVADEFTIDGSGSSALPESEYELDNLTEYNTAYNRRISMLGITTEEDSDGRLTAPMGPSIVAGPRKRKSVTFNEEEDVINPEDVDPTVGKFRNLIHTTIVIPTKRARTSGSMLSSSSSSSSSLSSSLSFLPRINPAPQTQQQQPRSLSTSPSSTSSSSIPLSASQLHFMTAAKTLGLASLPNPTPDLDTAAAATTTTINVSDSTGIGISGSQDKSPKSPLLFNDKSTIHQQQQIMALYDDLQIGGSSSSSSAIQLNENVTISGDNVTTSSSEEDHDKKTAHKYAKEAWPGRHHQPSANPLANF